MRQPVDLAAEAKHGALVRDSIEQGLVSAAHDISDGGLLVALAEMAISNGVGANIEAEGDTGFWFGEDQARYLLAVSAEKAEAFEAIIGDVPVTKLGKTGGAQLTIGGGVSISVSELRELNEGWFPALMTR